LLASSLLAQDRLYVVQSLDESLGQITLTNGDVNSHVLTLGYLPNDIISHNARLYVTNSGTNTIQEIDPVTNSTLRELAVNLGLNPWSCVALNPDTLAVSCALTENVTFIRLSDGMTVSQLPVGVAPQGILVHDDLLLVCLTRLQWPNYGPGVVMLYDRRTLQFVDSLPVGLNPQSAAVDNWGRLHVVCTGNYSNVAGEIRVIDLQSRTSIATLPIGGTPAAVSFGGGYAFVSAGGWQGPGLVYRYRLSDFAILNSSDNPIQTGEGAFDVEAAGDGSFYVSCFAANTVEHRAPDGALLASYPMSQGPGQMVLYGGQSPVDPREAAIPSGLSVLEAYPNPFNGEVKLQLNPPARTGENIIIYNMLGRETARIAVNYGARDMLWNALSANATALSTGTYFAVRTSMPLASGLRLNCIK
jgi:YVTN family beta-propeller protein